MANMVDFEFPEIPLWQKAKMILDEGGVGRLRHMAVNWNIEVYAIKMGLSSWKTRLSEGGGTLFSFVSHVFHYLEWILGPMRQLSCNLFSRTGLEGGNSRGIRDIFVTVALQSEKGVPVSVVVSTAAF